MLPTELMNVVSTTLQNLPVNAVARNALRDTVMTVDGGLENSADNPVVRGHFMNAMATALMAQKPVAKCYFKLRDILQTYKIQFKDSVLFYFCDLAIESDTQPVSEADAFILALLYAKVQTQFSDPITLVNLYGHLGFIAPSANVRNTLNHAILENLY